MNLMDNLDPIIQLNSSSNLFVPVHSYKPFDPKYSLQLLILFVVFFFHASIVAYSLECQSLVHTFKKNFFPLEEYYKYK